MELFAVAAGSALGAMARFGVSDWVLRAGCRKPWLGTLLVNLTGSGVAGCLAGAVMPWGAVTGALLLSGFLGSYTTVSAVSLEAVGLWQTGRRVAAGAYVMASTAGALGLAAAGWWAFAPPAVLS